VCDLLLILQEGRAPLMGNPVLLCVTCFIFLQEGRAELGKIHFIDGAVALVDKLDAAPVQV